MGEDSCNESRKHWILVTALALASWSGLAAQETPWEKATKAGNQLIKQERYAEAENSYLEALAEAEKPGVQDRRLADSLNNLAALYRNQGNYTEALRLLQRSLPIWDTIRETNPTDLATVLDDLAFVCLNQRLYDQAEAHYRRSLGIREKALGPEHTDVAMTLNSLAAVYCAQARYKEVEPLYKRALAIDEKALGLENRKVAATLNNLAVLYYNQGRYGEAEQVCLRALAVQEKTLGLQQLDLATTDEPGNRLWCSREIRVVRTTFPAGPGYNREFPRAESSRSRHRSEQSGGALSRTKWGVTQVLRRGREHVGESAPAHRCSRLSRSNPRSARQMVLRLVFFAFPMLATGTRSVRKN
jgi:tetratricopeptide (TPR) repeat protein